MGVGIFGIMYLILPNVVVFSLSIILRLFFKKLKIKHIMMISIPITIICTILLDELIPAISYYIISNIFISILGILLAEFCIFIVNKAESKTYEKLKKYPDL